MEWLSLIGSGIALTISAVCAILHSGREARGIPRHINDNMAAIAALRKQAQVLVARIRALEAEAHRRKEGTNAN